MDTEKKPYMGNVLNNPKYKNNKKTTKDEEIAGELNIQFESAAHNDRLTRLIASLLLVGYCPFRSGVE